MRITIQIGIKGKDAQGSYSEEIAAVNHEMSAQVAEIASGVPISELTPEHVEILRDRASADFRALAKKVDADLDTLLERAEDREKKARAEAREEAEPKNVLSDL